MSERHSASGATSGAVERPASFRLVSPAGELAGRGNRGTLPSGGLDTLSGRAETFFSRLSDGPRLLVGAIPFKRVGGDFLYQPERVAFENARPAMPQRWGAAPGAAAGWTVSPWPDAGAYAQAVAKCLALMDEPSAGGEALRKVVLSRSLEIAAPHPVDAQALLAHLARDPRVAAFMTPLPGENRFLVGATPELLVSRRGRAVVSHPLAGSARRSADPALDRQAAAGLERSEKDRREHGAVVEAVMDALAPHCSALSAPDGTTLSATASMWHLGTRILGTLKDEETPVAGLVAALHPTPAVCGLPRERAAQAIAELEGYDRGFYAGAVGWMDDRGDGEWYVSLRCAEIEGARLRLFAGAGIVPGSDPAAEVDETSAKFLALLSALGIDENGRPLAEKAA